MLTNPTMMSYLVKSKVLTSNHYNVESLQKIVTAGSMVNPKFFDDFKISLPNAVIINGYGTKTIFFYSNIFLNFYFLYLEFFYVYLEFFL